VIPLSQPTISYHLRLLTEAGLITSRREDGCVLRKLDRVALAALAGLLAPGGSWLAVDALRTGDPS
jgi:DNA-binding transcriptional ArsR family regulator